jgi:GT2 family glycosyltransferase
VTPSSRQSTRAAHGAGTAGSDVTAADVAVVVCAYTEERWGELLAAVRSVEAQDPPPSGFVVVVDHNDALLERLRGELAGSRVRVAANSLERGLGGGRNTGVVETTAGVVVFLDDDAEAREGWLERLCEAYADEDVLGVGGRIEALWGGERPHWLPQEFDWVVGCSYRGLPESLSPVRNLIGCNMSFRRSVFAELGGFKLGYGCDETEFCLRIADRWPEKRLMYAPAAVVSHNIAGSRETFRHFRQRCYFEGGSKAVVTWLHASKALSSERSYTLKTLPTGILRNVQEAVAHRNVRALPRAGAIVAGLAFTTAGYIAGKASIESAAARRGYSPESAATLSEPAEEGRMQHPIRPEKERSD